MTAEQWRPVPDFPGYEVSDLGRIASEYRFARRVLSPTIHTNGYYRLRLTTAPYQSCVQYVHRLVARAFCGEPADGQEVCHVSGDKLDNRPQNLRWDSHRENMRDIVRHGIHPWANKTHCPSGHAYTPENIYRSPQRPNARHCRTCHKAHSRAYYDRRAMRAAGISYAT